MKPYWVGEGVSLFWGDCIPIMAGMPADSVDAIVCDPPYSYSFMGREWDRHDTPQVFQDWCLAWATEAMRVLKPGGHLLAFGGTRTWHRLACGIEDAGFEIRDSIAWLYGEGFPKSRDVGKAIDRARHAQSDVLRATEWIARHTTAKALDAAAQTNGMGGHWTSQGAQAAVPTAEQWHLISHLLPDPPEWLLPLILPSRAPGEAWGQREKIGVGQYAGRGRVASGSQVDVGDSAMTVITAPATDAARQWQGWGTAMKPAHEPIVVARKPIRGTVAGNVLEHGTGAINIDACRVAATDKAKFPAGIVSETESVYGSGSGMYANRPRLDDPNPAGRWPPNVCLDEDSAAELDGQSGTLTSGNMPYKLNDTPRQGAAYGTLSAQTASPTYGDSGGASRFFPTFRYEAKASTAERPTLGGKPHPTVKPIKLMQWLVRLVTPPHGVVLDMFAGSGTTGEAAVREGFEAILIEKDPDSLPLIRERFQRPINYLLDFGDAE
jgi:DNA modification methylase